MKKQLLISILLVVISIQFVSAGFGDDFGYNNLGVPQLPPEINYSKLPTVNASEILITDEGLIDNVIDILGSWITNDLGWITQSDGNGWWCQLIGCTMAGDIDMGNNNINNIENATIIDRLFLGDSDHWLKNGAEGFNGLSTNAFALQHKEEHEAGTITFIVTSNKTNSNTDAIGIMAQSGLNNSAGYLGNSWMIAPNNLTNNLTDLSNCFFVINATGNTPRIFCDTSDTGADLFVQDAIQSGGIVFADGGVRVEEVASFIMMGHNFQIQNGSLHIFTPVTFISGVNASDEVTTFQENFVGGLESFTNLQIDVGNWFATSDTLCDNGDCANAIGISGSGNIIMEANVSTTNINITRLNFIYSLVNMLGANSFVVTANNNVGSGEVNLLIDSTNNVVLSSQSIAMPSSMWNQPKVSIRFECDVTQTNRKCFVDTISVNGTAISTTATEQQGFNSQICFSDGTKNAGGVCSVGVFYNASANTVFPNGNWNLSGANGFPTDHSALTNLEFAISGHTFSSSEQTMDIGSYNFTTSGNVVADEINITGHTFSIGDNTATDSFLNFLGLNNNGQIKFDESANNFVLSNTGITSGGMGDFRGGVQIRSDSKGILLGNAGDGDGKISYNGSAMIYNSSVTGNGKNIFVTPVEILQELNVYGETDLLENVSILGQLDIETDLRIGFRVQNSDVFDNLFNVNALNGTIGVNTISADSTFKLLSVNEVSDHTKNMDNILEIIGASNTAQGAGSAGHGQNKSTILGRGGSSQFSGIAGTGGSDFIKTGEGGDGEIGASNAPGGDFIRITENSAVGGNDYGNAYWLQDGGCFLVGTTNTTRCNTTDIFVVDGYAWGLGWRTESDRSLKTNINVFDESSTTKLYKYNTYLENPIVVLEEETIWSIDKNGKNVSRIINTEKIVGYERVVNPTTQIGLMTDEAPEEVVHCTGGKCGIDAYELASWNHNDIGKLIDENTLMKVSLCKLGETMWC